MVEKGLKDGYAKVQISVLKIRRAEKKNHLGWHPPPTSAGEGKYSASLS